MPIHIVPDRGSPSASIEIPLTNPLPDYDLNQMDQPTPREVDIILVSQGFRDLVDDARGILMDLLAHPPAAHQLPQGEVDLDQTDIAHPKLELSQLTGAICPADDEVYRPGLWIVLRDPSGPPKQPLPHSTQESIATIAEELARRLQL